MKQILENSVSFVDIVCWILVISFFCSCSLMFNGNFKQSLVASIGIVFIMILIGLSIDIIIEILKDVGSLGTITGFITNGPELICLVVGLSVGDVLFAASTPLGSNFMNPILLMVAAIIYKVLFKTLRTNWEYTLFCISATALIALSFYTIPTQYHIYWIGVAIGITTVLFVIRPTEEAEGFKKTVEIKSIANWNIIPAIALLIIAGYFLDPIVSFASAQSHAPKGVIGFIVLATLSSWPEFKSCLVLLNRRKYLAAILNITVSNITNIWLAIAGIAAYSFIV